MFKVAFLRPFLNLAITECWTTVLKVTPDRQCSASENLASGRGEQGYAST